MSKTVSIGKSIAPPRFVAFVIILVAAFLAMRLMMPAEGWQDAGALAFDLAAHVGGARFAQQRHQRGEEHQRRHAESNDANRVLVLGLTSLLTLTAMAAITAELPGARSGDPWAIGKLVGTLLLIWLFANSVYALHYAHAYYSADAGSGGDRGGIDFPGTKTPEYWDFAYFAFTLGMTFQTSDVEVSAPAVRKVVLLHCFAAFVFNIGVIAFTINVLGGAG